MMQRIVLLVIFFIVFGNTFAQPTNLKEEREKPSTASKQVSTFLIKAPQLQTSKKIWIYLPKKYDSTKKNIR